MYFIDKTNTSSRIRTSRSDDLRMLHNDVKNNPDPQARVEAQKSIDAIQHESKSVRSMREKLIKAHRENDHHEIKEINHYVMETKKYKNE